MPLSCDGIVRVIIWAILRKKLSVRGKQSNLRLLWLWMNVLNKMTKWLRLGIRPIFDNNIRREWLVSRLDRTRRGKRCCSDYVTLEWVSLMRWEIPAFLMCCLYDTDAVWRDTEDICSTYNIIGKVRTPYLHVAKEYNYDNTQRSACWHQIRLYKMITWLNYIVHGRVEHKNNINKYFF